MARQTHQTTPSLHDLYPELDEKAIASAAEALDRYVDLIARIAGRVTNDPEALAQLRPLTQDTEIRTIQSSSTPTSDQ